MTVSHCLFHIGQLDTTASHFERNSTSPDAVLQNGSTDFGGECDVEVDVLATTRVRLVVVGSVGVVGERTDVPGLAEGLQVNRRRDALAALAGYRRVSSMYSDTTSELRR